MIRFLWRPSLLGNAELGREADQKAGDSNPVARVDLTALVRPRDVEPTDQKAPEPPRGPVDLSCAKCNWSFALWQFLYFAPLPHQHDWLRPIVRAVSGGLWRLNRLRILFIVVFTFPYSPGRAEESMR